MLNRTRVVGVPVRNAVRRNHPGWNSGCMCVCVQDAGRNDLPKLIVKEQDIFC